MASRSGPTAPGRPSTDERGQQGHDLIRGGQINLHKSQHSAASLLLYLKTAMQNRHLKSKRKSNKSLPQVGGFIIGIQEPPVAFGKVFGLDKRHQLFQKQGGDKDRPRAALYISQGIQAWELPEHSNLDMVSCMVTTGGNLNRFIVSSLYLDINKPAWPPMLESLIRYCRQHRLQLLLLADTNAHSALWGHHDTNRRGEILEQGIASANLQVFNVGNKPTFFNRRAATTIDVTFGTSGFGELITNWAVSDEVAGTDHRLISFNLTISNNIVRYIREWNKGDWKLFQTLTEKQARHIPDLWNEESLEVEATVYTEIITKALDESHPMRAVTSTTVNLPHWWDEDATDLHRKVKKCRRIYQKDKSDSNFQELKEARKLYSKHIRRAKRQSWQQFTEKCTTPKMLATLQRAIQRRDNKKLGTIRREDGSLSQSSKEILNRLVNEHFPGNVAVPNAVPPFPGNSCNITAEEVQFLSVGMVTEAIKNFGSHKAPGADKISPIVLKHLGRSMLRKLTAIFKASVLLRYIPTCWRKSRVVYIPKPGKDDYCNVRSFRPISLTSFILKTLEKVWCWELNFTALRENPLSSNQHAFRSGYSTETALSNMVEYIEAAFIRKSYALGVFLDIQGAFDNVPTRVILQGMKNKGLPDVFIDWYKALLNNRIMVSSFGDTTLERKLTRGSPQGGVLSPIAWNHAFEGFLELYKTGPTRVVGFADDAGLIVTGDEPGTLRYQMQESVDKALNWGLQNGLKFSASKTQVILFTRNRKYKMPPKIIMGRKKLDFDDQVKYLGVTLDSKLSWSPHIRNKVIACKRLLFATKQAVGQLWGPSPRHMKWIYTGMIRPVLTYGSLVWAHAAQTKTFETKFRQLQRLSLMSMGHFRKSTPTAGLEIIMGLPPLDLWVRMEAGLAYRRTRGRRKLEPQDLFTRELGKRGHRQLSMEFLDNLGLDEFEEDILSEPAEEWNKKYWADLDSMETGADRCGNEPGTAYVYTDGSCLQDQVGAAYTVTYNKEEIAHASFHINPEATVFQAEIAAIEEAALDIPRFTQTCRKVVFFTDSQAALKALAANCYKSRHVWNCVRSLMRLCDGRKVELKWIKAHVGHAGNERADQLAKIGALGTQPSIRYLSSRALSSARVRIKCRNLLIQKWTEAWQRDKACRQTKQWFPEVTQDHVKEITNLDRKTVSAVVQIITGHNYLGRHNVVVGDTDDDECRFCMEDEETSLHIVAECPALHAARRTAFGVHFLEQPLKWSKQVLTFLREKSIGHLFNLDEQDQVLDGERTLVVREAE